MSYSTPISDTTIYKDLEYKLQTLSSNIKSNLTWLSYAFGLTDRIVDTNEGKEFIYPAIWQGTNAEEQISMMPSDLYDAFCFWVKDDLKLPDYNFSRAYADVSCIFYVDLKRFVHNSNYKLAKINIRQDIIEAFRQNQYCGLGVLRHKAIIEDDLAKIYDGYSIEQIDNKYKILPKYALRFDFEFRFLMECNSRFNTYA